MELEESDENKVSVYEDRVYSVDGTSHIRFHYGLFTNAKIADVAITLLGDIDDPNVHGFVFASNSISRLVSPTHASVLFWMNSDSKIRVKNGVIPLFKSLVGVPLDPEFSLAISLICDDQKYKINLSKVVSEETSEFEDKFCDNNLKLRVTFKCRN